MISNHRGADIALAILLLTIWTAANIWRHWGEWSVDMSAVYMAARFVALGELAQVYATPPDFFGTPPPERWTAELAKLGHDEFAVPYVYPPIWAWLLAPVAGNTGPTEFFDGARIVLFSATSASILLCWRMLRPGYAAVYFSLACIAICELTIPFQFAALLNQPHLLVIFLIVLSFERWRAERPVAAGVALGIAAAIKITPVLLCLIFLAERDRRAPLACVATAGAIGLVSLLLAGPGPHLEFLANVSAIERVVPIIGLNLNLEVLLHQIFYSSADRMENGVNILVGRDLQWITWTNRAALLAAVLLTFRSTVRLERTARVILRMFLLYTILVLFGPLAWAHYYVLPLLMLPGMGSVIGVRGVAALMVVLLPVFSLLLVLLSLVSAKTIGLFQFFAVPALLLAIVLSWYFARARARSHPVTGGDLPAF